MNCKIVYTFERDGQPIRVSQYVPTPLLFSRVYPPGEWVDANPTALKAGYGLLYYQASPASLYVAEFEELWVVEVKDPMPLPSRRFTTNWMSRLADKEYHDPLFLTRFERLASGRSASIGESSVWPTWAAMAGSLRLVRLIRKGDAS